MPRQNQDNETATLLLDHGADTNRADFNGTTPLLAAIANNSPATVEALLAQGADPGRQNNTGVTPLLAAIQRGQNATIQVRAACGGRGSGPFSRQGGGQGAHPAAAAAARAAPGLRYEAGAARVVSHLHSANCGCAACSC